MDKLDLYSWMREIEDDVIASTENLLDIINHEWSQTKIRDLSELSDLDKVA